MGITKEKLSISGCRLKANNPLPYLKVMPEDISFSQDSSLSSRERELFGYQCSRRVLPYLMQDNYTRNREDLELTAIVLENENLKAVFLPEYGGRLYSLYSKVLKRDLLYTNSVMQPANLAIRNAWFSGGIEWNIGRIGHTFTTCDSVFCTIVKGDNEEEFLRIYEFERQQRLFWQIDFHLPEGAKHLSACVRIINDDSYEKPMYWWTNTAVPLTQDTRIFSESPEVFYIKPEGILSGSPSYAHGKLPYVKDIASEDITYPNHIKFGSEYFFQNEEDSLTAWEAAAYEDGYLFYERSTSPLVYRKMFTWGNLTGGKQWCDFLSDPGKGSYLEIQAGLAPSQVHGFLMKANSSICFTQMFGGLTKEDLTAASGGDYETAKDNIYSILDEQLDEAAVLDNHCRFMAYLDKMPAAVLHYGSGFGALEVLRREQEDETPIPSGFLFLSKSLTTEQAIWERLLSKQVLDVSDPFELPVSYMTDPKWQVYFEKALPHSSDSWAFYYYYGVFLYENNECNAAMDAWKHSLVINPNPWSFRSVADAMVKNTSLFTDNADLGYYLKQAYEIGGHHLCSAFGEELIEYYIKTEDYEEAFTLYQKESAKGIPSDRFLVYAAKAAMAKNDFSIVTYLFEHLPAIIREGENSMTILWFEYTARKLALARNIPYTKALYDEVAATQKPPMHLDYRMYPSED